MANLASATTVNDLSGESSEADLTSTHPDSSDDTPVKKPKTPSSKYSARFKSRWSLPSRDTSSIDCLTLQVPKKTATLIAKCVPISSLCLMVASTM